MIDRSRCIARARTPMQCGRESLRVVRTAASSYSRRAGGDPLVDKSVVRNPNDGLVGSGGSDHRGNCWRPQDGTPDWYKCCKTVRRMSNEDMRRT